MKNALILGTAPRSVRWTTSRFFINFLYSSRR
jgi:hypothetical protein